MSAPYDGRCWNGGHPIDDLVFEDYDDDGFVLCADCEVEMEQQDFDDGIRVLVHDNGDGTATFEYAPIADPIIADLDRRLGES